MTYKVLYHHPCLDGFSAAWALDTYFKQKHIGDTILFIPVNYQKPPPAIAPDDNVIIVDFSYDLATMQAMAKVAHTVLVLDHHKTARANLASLHRIEFSLWSELIDSPKSSANLWATFDMDKSGAELAWQFFHTTPQPTLINYIADRDLFRNQLSYTKEINEFLKVQPQTFENWSIIYNDLEEDWAGILQEGKVLLLAKEHYLHEILSATKRRWSITGHSVPVANVPYHLATDAGHLLCQNEKFSATYFDGEHERHVSLRSSNEGLDVSVIAQKFGGGGHRNAAGFIVPFGWEGDK